MLADRTGRNGTQRRSLGARIALVQSVNLVRALHPAQGLSEWPTGVEHRTESSSDFSVALSGGVLVDQGYSW
jgi:hypothetical protein